MKNFLRSPNRACIPGHVRRICIVFSSPLAYLPILDSSSSSFLASASTMAWQGFS